jgi:hypothetical protein
MLVSINEKIPEKYVIGDLFDIDDKHNIKLPQQLSNNIIARFMNLYPLLPYNSISKIEMYDILLDVIKQNQHNNDVGIMITDRQFIVTDKNILYTLQKYIEYFMKYTNHAGTLCTFNAPDMKRKFEIPPICNGISQYKYNLCNKHNLCNKDHSIYKCPIPSKLLTKKRYKWLEPARIGWNILVITKIKCPLLTTTSSFAFYDESMKKINPFICKNYTRTILHIRGPHKRNVFNYRRINIIRHIKLSREDVYSVGREHIMSGQHYLGKKLLQYYKNYYDNNNPAKEFMNNILQCNKWSAHDIYRIKHIFRHYV